MATEEVRLQCETLIDLKQSVSYSHLSILDLFVANVEHSVLPA